MTTETSKEKDHGLGYVVDNKSAGARHAVSAENFNPKRHTKVRPLQPGETPLGYKPKRIKTDKPKPGEVPTPPAPTDK